MPERPCPASQKETIHELARLLREHRALEHVDGRRMILVMDLGGSGLNNTVQGIYDGQLSGIGATPQASGVLNIVGGTCDGLSVPLVLARQ